ncbi:PVC-type heme-binding CxxCH protein [Humisphaera borealis]|uniref:HEAT repeat domain-containing protein n=1 Tax=Humisphaera borealis TaxID=2807512 RepID=A0A7M2X2C4_9BACT|nr:PVC-type heme-binding CxxCH protein [Humisphaera borealis]QOV91898.1 HEAT repeat domain-containing protein [Humisphaera borealis]
MILKNTIRSAAVALALASGVAHAQRSNSNAPPNDPATELKAFKVAEGFEANLFAAEPMLLKPIGITFDAKGRLWVAGSPTYPQIKPGDAPQDKIYVLEDTDGDGKADKSTVFAEGLFIATAVEMADDGGVYVANSTEILHLKDTDGDGKADTRKVVLSGFGTEDTHHVIHAFRWDYGGRLNFLQGIYIGSRVETPRGTKVGLASTLWQFRPDSMNLNIYCQGLVNPWGVTWDRYGQMFLTDGAGGEGVNFAPPGAQFTAAYEAKRILKGLNPGSPKFCGAEIISSRHFPADWQGDLITNDFRANRTVRFKLSEDGSGFSAKLMTDVITSADRAYRPIDLKMGPDGALYIADWYNPIINHGEVDFRDPRRDKVHGRIWRVTAKGGPAVAKPVIAGAGATSLIGLLAAPEQWTRLQAKIALRREIAPKEAVLELGKHVKTLLGARETAAAAANALAPLTGDDLLLEYLWTYETLDVVEPTLLATLLDSKTSQVRAAAVRVAGHWADRLPSAIDQITKGTTDDFPRVRLEAVRALADIGKATGNPAVVPVALGVLAKPVDPVIDFAMSQILGDLKDVWLPAATSGSLKFASPDHLNYALKAVQSGDALKKIVADLKAGKLAPAASKDAFDLIAALGTPADLSLLLDQAVDAKASPAMRLEASAALERAAKQRKAKPDGPTPARVRKLLADNSPALQEYGARLAGLYKAADAKAVLEAKLSSADTANSVRAAAAVAIADFGAESGATLQKYAAAGQPSAVRSAAIAGLASLDAKGAAVVAADYLTGAKSSDDPSQVLGAFLKREGGVQALAAVLKGKTLPADTAKLALRYVQGVGVDLGELGEVIRTSAGASGGGPVQLTADEMKRTADEAMKLGDAARGELVYRSKSAGCVQCHMIGGVGGPLAPDIRAIGASSPVDYIIDSILIPAKAVKDGYAATSVSTKDGDLIQGIKVREDSKELILRDNARDEIPVSLADIKKRVEGGSLMPAGLADGLTRQEFLDLVRFLSELGKPGPFSVPTEPVVRRWRLLDPTPAALAKTGATPPSDGDVAGWFALYGKVNGDLPIADLLPAASEKVAFIRFELDVAAAGEVKLSANSAVGLSLFAGGKPVAGTGNTYAFAAPKGVATVTVRVDLATRGEEPLRLVVAEGSTRATPVVGR